MIRLGVSAALLLSTFATCSAHAQEVPDDDTVSAAAEAGVSATDLLGAMNSTGMEARQYLETVGELAVAPPTPSAAPVIPGYGIWDLIAKCESGGNWHAISSNGRYFGGLQEDLTFWTNYGGRAYAARPDLASPAAQIAVAIRGQAVQGFGAWPVCSRRLGLR